MENKIISATYQKFPSSTPKGKISEFSMCLDLVLNIEVKFFSNDLEKGNSKLRDKKKF